MTPTDATAATPVLQVRRRQPAGTEPQLAVEIRTLLRARLRLACLVILTPVVLEMFWIVFVPNYSISVRSFDFLLYWVVVGVVSALLALLYRPRLPSLTELRVVEEVFFAFASGMLLFGQYRWYRSGWLPASADAGVNEKILEMAGDSFAFPWFLLIVLYGTCIPTSGRRCAATVGPMAAAALALVVYLGLSDPTLGRYVLTKTLAKVVFWTAIAVAVAVFGSQRLNTLRREAFQARKMGQYRLGRRLGSGGMGEVYLAEHQLLRRPCAVKLIRPEQAGTATALERFEREVQSMATLNHPNAVDIYDFGRADDGTFYYAMEYLPGLNLEQLVETHGRLPAGRVVHLLTQVCGVLREAHTIGLIHRDIKPGNILVSERGGVYDTAKLLDFGLVQPVVPAGADRLTTEGMVVGTPLFMSPEQASGDPQLDARTDIYSLGAVAYYLLTASPVFVRESSMRVLAAHISEPVLPPRDLQPDIPPDLQDVVLRCLEKRPDRRYADVASLEAALRGCACAGQWTQEQAAAWWREHGSRAADLLPGDGIGTELPTSTSQTFHLR